MNEIKPDFKTLFINHFSNVFNLLNSQYKFVINLFTFTFKNRGIF